MPINSSISIRGSVGRGARNDAADVRIVQRRLNDLMHPPRGRLVEDGRCGPRIEAMIADFQRVVLRRAVPDVRVDPIGDTIRAMNNPASENTWAGASMVSTAPPHAAPASGGAQNLTYPANATPADRENSKIDSKIDGWHLILPYFALFWHLILRLPR